MEIDLEILYFGKRKGGNHLKLVQEELVKVEKGLNIEFLFVFLTLLSMRSCQK
jgi:hypothetical protein